MALANKQTIQTKQHSTMNRLTFITILGLMTLSHSINAQQYKSWNITFDYNQTTITKSSQQTLDELVDFASEVEIIQIELKGHTDSIGAQDLNQTLSDQRARVVQEYLSKRGIDSDKISLSGFNYSQPLADNSDKTGRAKNRRTEIMLTYQPITTTLKEHPILTESSNVEPMSISADALGKSTFTFDKDRDLVISTEGGSYLKIKSDQINDRNALDTREITVNIYEYTDPQKIIRERVSTISNGTLLQSGGMLFLDLSELGAIKGCVEVFVKAEEREGMRPYFSGDNRDVRETNWQNMNEESMRYDAERKGYVFKVCDPKGRIGVNVDKPLRPEGTVMVKVKQQKACLLEELYTVSEDGSITNAFELKYYKGSFWMRNSDDTRYWKRKNYYLIPYDRQKENTLTGKYSRNEKIFDAGKFSNNKEIYTINQRIASQKPQKISKKIKEKLNIWGKFYTWLPKTKIKLKQPS